MPKMVYVLRVHKKTVPWGLGLDPILSMDGAGLAALLQTARSDELPCSTALFRFSSPWYLQPLTRPVTSPLYDL
jgi:hypothetical protein